MKTNYITHFVILVLCSLMSQAEPLKLACSMESIGVITDASTGQKIGSAFITDRNNDVVSCAHVVADRTNLVYDSADATNPVRRLKLKYILPRFDLAVLTAEKTVETKPLNLGDIRRIRPGDRIMYVGYVQGTRILNASAATVTATGAALNDGAIVEFLEFQGKGMPGYSGGPVFDLDCNVVAVMREAWTKRGVKGGDTLLINRAFSVGVLKTLEGEVYGRNLTPQEPYSGNLSLIEVSGILQSTNQEKKTPNNASEAIVP